MFKKQVKSNVELLDERIRVLSEKLNNEEFNQSTDKVYTELEKLIELRCDLAESRDRESYGPLVVSGLIQAAGILLVLHYEKTDVITSKVFGMATGLFKGSR